MRRDGRGITLIDSLVIIGVLGVMALLVVPAVRNARAAARQVTCVDNLRQIGLALHNYHSAHDCLPMSQVRGEGHGNGHSVFTLILPYLEQAPTYNMYNFSLENGHESNLTAVRTRVATFECPDNEDAGNVKARDVRALSEGNLRETEARFPESKSTFGPGHYAANWGGGRGAWGEEFLKRQGDYRGVMMTVIAPDGMAPADDGRPKARVVSFRDILDGTATTLAMAEKRDSFGWAVGGWGGSEFDVHTRANYEGDDPLARKVYTGAVHEEGVGALLCDGAVRRLTPKFDAAAWYALSTRSGGEALKPDLPGATPILSTPQGRKAEEDRRLEKVGQTVARLIRQVEQHPPRPAAARSRMSLYAMDMQTGKVTLVAAEPDPGLDQCGSPSWTRDGRRILYDAQPRNKIEATRLKAIDPAERGLKTTDLGPGNCPTPSPSGDRVVFLLNPGQVVGAETGVWIMQRDGSERRRLGGYGRPCWSADGHQFLIISFARSPEVTVIDEQWGRPSGILQIPPEQTLFSIPSWAEDDAIVAVIGDEDGDTIALLDVSTPADGKVKEVLWKRSKDLAVMPREPVYSPATRRCVFVGEDAKGMALYAFERGKPGETKRLEAASDTLIRDLAFSPDGRYVLFSSNRPDRP
jgi:Tol biopolymer transport system component/type II secretory pathway pseudopilin PulG